MTVQAATHMMRLCVLTRLTHICRAVPRPRIQTALSSISSDADAFLRQLLGLPTQVPLAQREGWLRVYMPSRNGGVGVPDVNLTADAAFVGAAWLAVPQLRELLPNCPGIDNTADMAQYLLPGYDFALTRLTEDGVPQATLQGLSLQTMLTAAPAKGLQATLSSPLYARAVENRLAEAGNISQTATACALSSIGWGWATASRSDPNYRMDDDTWTLMMLNATRQHPLLPAAPGGGQPLCPAPTCCLPVTTVQQHADSCNVERGTRTSRHNRTYQRAMGVLQWHGWKVQAEPELRPVAFRFGGLKANAPPDAIRADIHAMKAIKGVEHHFYLDFVVTAPHLHLQDAGKPGGAAERAEQDKRTRYATFFNDPSQIYPTAVETFGRLGKGATDVIAKLAKTAYPSKPDSNDPVEQQNAARQGWLRATFCCELRTAISIGVAQGNAKMVRGVRARMGAAGVPAAGLLGVGPPAAVAALPVVAAAANGVANGP
jgi:hypothetical protein